MPIDIAAIFKQQGRNDRLGDGAANFFHLIDAADIDFKVVAIIGLGGDEGPVDGIDLPATVFGDKFVIANTETWTGDLGQNAVTDYDNGDIIERRTGVYGLHLDVSRTQSSEGTLVYNSWNKKFYYYDGTTWKELGTGSVTGAAGETFSVQFKAANGSFTGNSGLLFNNTTRRLVLGSDVLFQFGDGTTQGTARNFYGATGVTSALYPLGFSGAGNTGDRLLVATGPVNDPLRNYIRFGNAWVQTGVAGVGQGIQGTAGVAGVTGGTGATGAMGATGATGITGASLTSVSVDQDTGMLRGAYLFNGNTSSLFDIGYVQGTTGSTGATGQGITGVSLSGNDLVAQYLFADGTISDEFVIGNVRGNTGSTGATGITGASLTSVSVDQSTGMLRGAYLFNGSTSSLFDIGYVQGTTGTLGATGSTGPKGSTGAGTTGVTGQAAGIRYTYSTTLFDANYGIHANSGGTGVYISKIDNSGVNQSGFIQTWDDSTNTVKGTLIIQPQYAYHGLFGAAPGSTGQIVFSVTSVREYTNSVYELGGTLLSGTAGTNFLNLYTPIVANFSRAGDRGVTGATGSVNLTTATFETDTGIEHTAVSVNTSFSRLARKVMFLQDNGSLTFDYLFYPDIFNANDFQFAITSFSKLSSFASTQLMSGSNINLGTPSGTTFTAAYRNGPPATASINLTTAADGSGFPIFFNTSAMTSLAGSLITATLAGTGGSDRSTTIRLSATGTDADGTTRNDTENITINFRNHLLYGLTMGAVITGGATGIGMTAAWWFRDHVSTKPVAESITGWGASVTQSTYGTPEGYYLYIAYPSRLHDDASFFDDPAIAPIKLNGSAVVGGMSLQGYGIASDAGGLSTINYTNSLGWTEPYKVLRTDNTFTTDVFTFEFLSS